MRNSRMLIVLVGAAVLLVAGATLWQATATLQVAAAASAEEVGATDRAGILSPAAAVAQPPSYRSHMGECYDVSLQEAESCQASSIEGATTDPRFSRSGPDECFDVPLSETCYR